MKVKKGRITAASSKGSESPKFHITAKGEAAVCNARKKPCPLGGADEHFDTIQEARKYAQEKLEREHGLLAVEDPDIEETIPEYNPPSGSKYHIVPYRGAFEANGLTFHARVERKERIKKLQFYLRGGKVINRFHYNDGRGAQIHEVHDNGLINLYDAKTKQLITSVAPLPDRFLRLYEGAGLEVPDDLLKVARRNANRRYNKL